MGEAASKSVADCTCCAPSECEAYLGNHTAPVQAASVGATYAPPGVGAGPPRIKSVKSNLPGGGQDDFVPQSPWEPPLPPAYGGSPQYNEAEADAEAAEEDFSPLPPPRDDLPEAEVSGSANNWQQEAAHGEHLSPQMGDHHQNTYPTYDNDQQFQHQYNGSSAYHEQYELPHNPGHDSFPEYSKYGDWHDQPQQQQHQQKHQHHQLDADYSSAFPATQAWDQPEPTYQPDSFPPAESSSHHWGKDAEPEHHHFEEEAWGKDVYNSGEQASRGGGGAGDGGGFQEDGLDLEILLIDLQGAELQTYGSAFLGLAGPTGGSLLQPDNIQMREFLLTNSAISSEDLDTELLKVASSNDTFTIDTEGFLGLLREHAVSENDALQQFIALSPDGTDISGEDCRSGLSNLLQQRLHTTWPASTTERVVDVVMNEAQLTIAMEQWIGFARHLGRIARLARYLKL